MSVAQLLTELQTLGVKVWPDAGALRFKAPAGAMTPELTARLKEHKPELLTILANEPAANDETTPGLDLPLLAAVIEFQRLIDRLCRIRGHSETTRGELHALLNHKAPMRIRPELEEMRELVKRAEAGECWPTLSGSEP